MKVEVWVAISERARKSFWFEKGEVLPAEKLFDLEWKETSHEVRVALYQIAGSIEAIGKIDLRTVQHGADTRDYRVDKYPGSKREWDLLFTDYLAHRMVESKDMLDFEKQRWIDEHGSQFLKDLKAHRYNAQAQYVFERARLEHPGFVVVDEVIPQPVDTPSQIAFETALEHQGRVVLISCPPPNEQEGLFPAPCEAVLIERYLGSHFLVNWMPSQNRKMTFVTVANADRPALPLSLHDVRV
jgi:hypothetical protein